MKIKKIQKKTKSQLTLDIEVGDSHTYQLSNGCVSHNTSSIVLGTSSGIHAWHAPYYIRRIRIGKNEVLYKFLKENHPELVADEFFRPHDTAVLEIPQKAPLLAINRNESIFALLSRIKEFNLKWIRGGHRNGENYNNVSATVSIKPNEWELVGEWMWENRNNYNGLSVIPFIEEDHNYTQMPFEEIDEQTYNEMYKKLKEVDILKIKEVEDSTDLSGELACAGGACEIV
jgi:ribonucleoside-diphosphate reductase alpha chain